MTYSIDPELARWLPVLPEQSYANVKAARAKLRAQVARWPKNPPPRPVEVRGSRPGTGRGAFHPGPGLLAGRPQRTTTRRDVLAWWRIHHR